MNAFVGSSAASKPLWQEQMAVAGGGGCHPHGICMDLAFLAVKVLLACKHCEVIAACVPDEVQPA